MSAMLSRPMFFENWVESLNHIGNEQFEGYECLLYMEVADSTRYGATIRFLCNEALAGGLMALREGNSALHWAATRPEDNTPPTTVAVGHFVQGARDRFMRTPASLPCIAERYIKYSAGKSLRGRDSAEGLCGKRVCDTFTKDENILWLFCLPDNLRHFGPLLHGPGVQGLASGHTLSGEYISRLRRQCGPHRLSADGAGQTG